MSDKTFLSLFATLFLLIGIVFLLVYANINIAIGVMAIGAAIRILVYKDIKYRDEK